MTGGQTTPVVLRVEDLTVDYATPDGWKPALEPLSFTLHQGKTLGLLGRSGSGKTTASKAILGLLPVGARVGGSVRFQGTEILGRSDRELRRLRWEQMALVPQAAMNSLDPVKRVDRQIAEVIGAHRHIRKSEALAMARDSLERVGIHPDRSSSFPHQFSGGMRQRALIAMATVLEPILLIADEPTTGLDVVVQDRVLELLVDAKREAGLSLLVVTHDLGVASELCDDLIVLEHGRVVERGSRDASRLLAADEPSAVHAWDDQTASQNAFEIQDFSVRHASGRGLAALQEGRSLPVVEQVSLDLRAGEILGLAGESGSGKSSLVSAIMGLNTNCQGQLRVRDGTFQQAQAVDWNALRSSVQMVFQDPYDSLNPRLTVKQAVAEPLVSRRDADVDRGTWKRTVDAKVAAALEAAQLDPDVYAGRLPNQLSGGERQRVAIARALVLEPAVILADEPVSMLDEQTADEIVGLLRDLCKSMRVAVLLVSHDVSLLRRVSDRLAVMYCGRIVESGPTRDVLDNPRHHYTRALIQAVPVRDPTVIRTRVLLPGEPPSLEHRPEGCAFHPRCQASVEKCGIDVPGLEGAQHRAACWNPAVIVESPSAGSLT